MKHYPHHIGDFDRATRHLTRIERSVYRDLIELYYDTEQMLTLDVVSLCRRIIARSNEESTAVEQVLNEFFTETPTGWYHERCEAEIEAYRANNSQRARAGKASAEAKRLKKQQAINGNSTPVDHPLNSVATNGNGVSTNQSTNQPINQSTSKEGARKRSPSFDPAAITLPDWLNPETWRAWCQDRKKRGNAITEKAAELQLKKLTELRDTGHTPESVIEHSIASGYQGLFAPKTITQVTTKAGQQAESFRERDERMARERWEQAAGRAPQHAHIIDITPAEPARLLEIEP